MKRLLSLLVVLVLLVSALPCSADSSTATQGSASAHVYTFEELTGLSREDIDHIIIRSGMNGINYSTTYDKVITDIYNTINTKSFLPYVKEGNSGGWIYEIIFFDKANKKYTYNFSSGITPESGHSGLSYRSENVEELKAIVEKAYNLISNDCSEWSADYIVQAKDIGLLENVSGLVYKENITREKFCEILFNMYSKSIDNPKTWNINMKHIFDDCTNEKVAVLYLEGIIKGKGDEIFAPDDYLTREEAATILMRTAEILGVGFPENAYDKKIYNDEDLISDWAFPSVHFARKMGIMVGVSDTEFSPRDKYSSEQAIATIIRLYNNN